MPKLHELSYTAWFFSSVAICYTFPVLWMISFLSIIDHAKATRIVHILKVVHQGASPGAKSDVYGCLVYVCVSVCRDRKSRQHCVVMYVFI